MVAIPREAAARLVATLQASKWWDIEEGEAGLFAAWKHTKHSAQEWEALLAQAIKS
jgi:hypothetical protein